MNILTQMQRLNLAGKQATNLARDLQQLTPDNEVKLMQILEPLMEALSDVTQSNVLDIEDVATRDKLKGLLVGLQSSLNTIQLIVVSDGGA
jgi:ABC-type Zn uptake system ZnuABC Zn-binding protein ZnuA